MRNTTQYIIPGTKFYRLASRSIFKLYGSNLQNVEKNLRRMYVPDAGKIFNQRDQSGAEALIVAYLTRHGKFRDLFLNNIKPHVFVALHLFADIWKSYMETKDCDIHCDVDELLTTSISNLTSNPWWKQIDKLIKSSDGWQPSQRYYYIAKQVCHSSNYGIKAQMFCLNTLEKSRGKIALKKEQAETFLSMYHGLFPEIREWHYRVEQQVRETKILFNLLGEPIQFTGDLSEESSMKECFSAIPQSTVAEITRQAVINMQNFVETTGMEWDFLADTHDSFMEQSPIEESEHCQKIMKEFIEPELENFAGEKFKMKSEGASGFNWAPRVEHTNSDGTITIKNPNGLKEVNI